MYPTPERTARLADGAMHSLGLGFALAGAVALTVWAAFNAGTGQAAALAVYGVALVATFAASAIYHMTPWHGLRPVLRRIDHAAIYLKIAGTYTPLVVMVGSALGYGVLAIVWALAVFGMVRKLFYWQVPGRFGPVLYLVMGWMSVLVIWPAIPVLPGLALALIAAGGLTYSAGVVFYAWDGLRFGMAIWHGFVVTASALFFAAIAVSAAALA